jgi:rhomboid family GlyGly-CTERM serine protease
MMPGWSLSISLLLAIAAAAVQFSPAAAEWLQYDRVAILSGQLWRIVTCHLTHWSLDHFFWDTVALLVLGLGCEARSRPATVQCLCASALLIPLSVTWLMPEMATYRGLSGIDSALFALLAGLLLRECWPRKRYGVAAAIFVALIAFAAKTVYEYASGDTLFVDSAAATMVPLPLVHVVGGLIGLAACSELPFHLFTCPVKR